MKTLILAMMLAAVALVPAGCAAFAVYPHHHHYYAEPDVIIVEPVPPPPAVFYFDPGPGPHYGPPGRHYR